MHQHLPVVVDGIFNEIHRIFEAVQQVCILLVKDADHMLFNVAWNVHIEVNHALQDKSPV